MREGLIEREKIRGHVRRDRTGGMCQRSDGRPGERYGHSEKQMNWDCRSWRSFGSSRRISPAVYSEIGQGHFPSSRPGRLRQRQGNHLRRAHSCGEMSRRTCWITCATAPDSTNTSRREWGDIFPFAVTARKNPGALDIGRGPSSWASNT